MSTTTPDTTPKAASESSTPAGGKSFPEPSRAEALMFFAVIKHLKTKPDVDWNLVAEECGLKNGSVASVRYRQIKQKLGFDTPGAVPKGRAAGTPKAPKSTDKKTPKKRGAAVKDEDADPLNGATSELGDASTPTLAAKKRKTRAEKKTFKSEATIPADEDYEDKVDADTPHRDYNDHLFPAEYVPDQEHVDATAKALEEYRASQNALENPFDPVDRFSIFSDQPFDASQYSGGGPVNNPFNF